MDRTMPVNLDHDEDARAELYGMSQREAAEAYGCGSRTAALLIAYARAITAAQRRRIAGNVDAARSSERCAERWYEQLPASARW